MKANELMIGDWVCVTKNFTQKYHKIRALSNDEGAVFRGVYVNEYGVKNHSIFSPNDTEPIPLTKEILEKNGWPRRRWKHHLEDVFSDSNGEPTNNLIALWSYEDSFVLVIRGEECSTKHIETFDIRKRIRYVHELQHALGLCGIEKEIEL